MTMLPSSVDADRDELGAIEGSAASGMVRDMTETNDQSQAVPHDAQVGDRIEALRSEMKAGFERAFAQTQGGFDEFHRFAMFLDERVRRDMNHGFGRMERRFEAVDTRFDRQDLRFDAIDRRFLEVDQRFEGIESRLDEIIRLIKER